MNKMRFNQASPRFVEETLNEGADLSKKYC